MVIGFPFFFQIIVGGGLQVIIYLICYLLARRNCVLGIEQGPMLNFPIWSILLVQMGKSRLLEHAQVFSLLCPIVSDQSACHNTKYLIHKLQTEQLASCYEDLVSRLFAFKQVKSRKSYRSPSSFSSLFNKLSGRGDMNCHQNVRSIILWKVWPGQWFERTGVLLRKKNYLSELQGEIMFVTN